MAVGVFLILLIFQNCAPAFVTLEDQGIQGQESLSSLAGSPCSVEHGTGVINSSGICQVVSCEPTHHPEQDINKCVDNQKACFIANGTGQQVWENGVWKSCRVQGCSLSFHQDSNQCVANTRECQMSGGSAGNQVWQNGAWGSCQLAPCARGEHLENGSCLGNTKTCSIENGQGEQAWNGSSWGQCLVRSCASQYHQEGNECLSNTRECTTASGRGEQVWTSTGWGSCEVTACQEAFHSENGACVNNFKACQNAQGKIGTQAWGAQAWTSCLVCPHGQSSYGNVCIDNISLVRFYYSYLPSCWQDGRFSCAAEPVFGAIGVPNRFFASAQDEIVFTVSYSGAKNILLNANHVQLIGATQACQVTVTTPAELTRREVRIRGCTGVGALRVAIGAGTAQSERGAFAKAIEPSSDVMISNAPNLLNVTVTQIGPLQYPGAHGQSLPYEVLAPADYATRSKTPVVIWIHGGGWSGGNYGLDTDTAKAIASAGFLVVNADYRLMVNDPNTYPQIVEPSVPYHQGSDDIAALIQHIRSNVHLLNGDPQKLSLAGGSAGGHLVHLQASRPENSYRFRCVANLAGPSELESLLNSPVYPVSSWIVGSVFGRSQTVLYKNSPARLVSGLKTDVLGIFHQVEDNLVPIDQPLQSASRVRQSLAGQRVIVNFGNAINSAPVYQPTPTQVTHLYEDMVGARMALKSFFQTECR